VVFSIFKKDPKDNKARSGDKSGSKTRVAGKPIGRPLDGPVNRSGKVSTQTRVPSEAVLPDKVQARAVAMETAAKIDAIESEMARDFLRPGGTSTQDFANSAANSTLQRPPAAEPVEDPAGDPTKPPLEFGNSDFMNGDALAIEVSGSTGHEVYDEVAILFANGQSAPAEAILREAIESGAVAGAQAGLGWRMLLELVQQRGDRVEFDRLAVDYAAQHGEIAPVWIDYPEDGAKAVTKPEATAPSAKPVTSAPAAAVAGEPGTVTLPVVLDVGIVQPLEELKRLSQQFAQLTIDASNVQSADAVGAELLLRVIKAFKKASHQLVFIGPENLIPALCGAIEPGRRDPSDAAWMLLIEIHRLLGDQAEFEESAIQYCITFEVSPPSWEPPTANFQVRPATPRAATTVMQGSPEPPVAAGPAPEPEPEGLCWSGTIGRDGEPAFSLLLGALAHEKLALVDCTTLRRIEFNAASNLLSVLTRAVQGGGKVELRNLNPLVAQLLQLLGVSGLATLSLR
jgi:anti-anti-sigma regulatory factor